MAKVEKRYIDFDPVTSMAAGDTLTLWSASGAAVKRILYSNFFNTADALTLTSGALTFNVTGDTTLTGSGMIELETEDEINLNSGPNKNITATVKGTGGFTVTTPLASNIFSIADTRNQSDTDDISLANCDALHVIEFGLNAIRSYNDNIPGFGYLQYGVHGTTGPGRYVYTDQDIYAVYNEFFVQHDSTIICYDCYYTATGFKSGSANSNFAWYKDANRLRLQYDKGIAAGSALTLDTILNFDAANDRVETSLDFTPSSSADLDLGRTARHFKSGYINKVVGNEVVVNSGPLTNTDISSTNVLQCNTSGADIEIQGVASGEDGQFLVIYKSSSSNAVIIRNNHGSGTQKFLTADGQDLTLTTYGSAFFRFNGTSWIQIGVTPEADGKLKINSQTGTSYTLTSDDNGALVLLFNAAAITLTAPQATTENIATGFNSTLIQMGAGQVTVAKEGSDHLLSADSLVKLRTTYSAATITMIGDYADDGSYTYYLSGDLTA